MAAAVSLFLFGAVTAALSLQLPVGTLRMPGSGLFPLVLGLALMVLAAGQGIRLRLAQSKAAKAAAGTQQPGAPAEPGGSPALRVALFMVAVLAATALLEPLGYALAGFVLMLALLRILGQQGWLACGLIALASAAASYVVFVVWLKIPLPAGPLF